MLTGTHGCVTVGFMSNESYGSRLRKIRHSRGKTLMDVASVVGKSVPYMSDVETGRRRPLQERETVLMCDFLGVSAQDLLTLGAEEKGSIEIRSANPHITEIAAGLARRGASLSDEDIRQLRRILLEEGD